MLSSKSLSPQVNAETLVIIDSAIENPEFLLNGIIQNAVTIILNPHQDGIEKITQALECLNSISALHIISHGSPGSLQLGNTQLSLDTLEQYKKQLQNWFKVPLYKGDLGGFLVLYGCNVAAGDAGSEFIEKLHTLTGAEIAASATPIGNKALGGNWDLEVKTSEFNVELAVSSEVQESYSFVLGTQVDSFTISESANTPQTLTFNGEDFTFGTGETLIVQSFEIGTGDDNKEFSLSGGFFNFALQRSEPENKKQLVWFDVDVEALIEQDNNINENEDIDEDNANVFKPAFAGFLQADENKATYTDLDDIMADILFTGSLNSGTDNVFANNGGNTNNIERVDYFNSSPIDLPEGNFEDSGFLILERSRNATGDNFQIAAITGVDENEEPSEFGTLHRVDDDEWGRTGEQVNALIMDQENGNDNNLVELRPAQYLPELQDILGVYVSLADLELEAGDEFYGYSLFADDVPNDRTNAELLDLTDTTTYPRDTNNQDGGLDLIEGGYLYSASDRTDTSLRLDLDGDNSTTTGRDFESFDTETGFVTRFTGTPISIGDVDVDIVDSTDQGEFNSYTVIITLDDPQPTESLSVSGDLPEGIEVFFDYDQDLGDIWLDGLGSIEDFETAIEQIVYNDTAAFDPNREPERVNVEIIDGFNFSNIAQTIIEFTEPGENTPPVADDDNYTTPLDTPLTINTPGVLEGDTDADGDPLTVAIATEPSSGSVTLNPDGSFSYTPNPGFIGDDSFTYIANDGEDNSNVATVTISVADPTENTPPVAD
ncbi:MAG: DUF4347 domain-containing protein, partial [Microcoleaceae cyanobacterium]